MRVTHRMIIDNAIRSMSDNLQKLGDLQSRAASGKSFQKASDAPRAARAALALRSNINANNSYLETISAAQNWLSASGEALQRLEDLAVESINTALEGISDTNNEARTILAGELDRVIEDALAAANSKHRGSYLFAGHLVKTAPFRFVAGSPDSVAFDGDSGVIQRTIGPDETVTVNFDADAAISPFFAAVIEARDALLADDVPGLQTAVDNLRAAQELIQDQEAATGIRLQQMEQNQQYLEETQLALEGLLSREEDIDLVEVITELRHQETIYQSVLQVGQRTLATVNLFDLMK